MALLGLSLLLPTAAAAALSLDVDPLPAAAPGEHAATNMTVRYCRGPTEYADSVTIRLNVTSAAPWAQSSLNRSGLSFPPYGANEAVLGTIGSAPCEMANLTLDVLVLPNATPGDSVVLRVEAQAIVSNAAGGGPDETAQANVSLAVANRTTPAGEPTPPTQPSATSQATTPASIPTTTPNEAPPPAPAWATWGLGAAAIALGIALVLLAWRRRRKPAERYRVVRDLPPGAFGRAFVAEDTLLGRRVVLKQPGSGASEEALREARSAGALNHPNVVTVHDVETAEGRPPRIVMEYVEGGSLAARLRQGPLGWPAAKAIALDVLAALEAVHARGIVHRDLKPENILLTRDGRAKVADFGVAHAAELATLPGGAAHPGTPAYMAPEQRAGGRIDARTDLYAVGVVLREMLTGARDGARDARLPDAVRAFLERALADEPARRFGSAGEMRASLLALGESYPSV